jgi:predicted RNA-binding protein
MCLAKAFGKKSNEEVMLADSIARIFLEDGKVKMYDIFGDETIVNGTLLDMDLERSIVKIALAE